MKINQPIFVSLFFVTLLILAVFMSPQIANASKGEEILKSRCSSCHAIEKPGNFTLDRLWERKGPDLYYSGIKFNKTWLVKWLQNPERIRPAGEFYYKHVKTGEKEDVIDEASLTPHVRLSREEADTVADSLMERRDHADALETGAFKNGTVSLSVGSLYFNKLRGCASCHMAKKGVGGLSAPELYTGGERLQPDYILGYIKNPQKFDPYIWMPKFNLSDSDFQMLTSYILQISRSEEKK